MVELVSGLVAELVNELASELPHVLMQSNLSQPDGERTVHGRQRCASSS